MRLHLGFLTCAAIAAFCFAAPDGLYAQRGRGGGGPPDRGNGNPGRGESRGDVGRPANTPAKPDTPKPKKPEKTLADEIQKDGQVPKNVQELLPPGMTLEQASSGFKNRGQFIAGLHVSKNLDIPFASLKARMTGTDAVSLGKAIHALKPNLTDDQIKAEEKKAEKQAKDSEKKT